MVYTNKQSWGEQYDISLKKPEGTYRVFYVGDSNTYAPVAPEKKMVKIVERELNKIYVPKGKKIEVINTGTTSWSPLIYYLLIKTQLLDYNPDLIVINVDMTDVVNDAAYKKLLVLDNEGWPAAVHPASDTESKLYRMTPEGIMKISPWDNTREQIHQFIAAKSALYSHFENFVYKNILKKPTGIVYQSIDYSADWLLYTWTNDIEENVAYTLNILNHTISLLKSRGIKIALTGVPHYPQFTGAWSARPFETLAKTTRESGIPFLNMYEEINDYVTTNGVDASQLYWKEDSTHFNEEGNAVWAKSQLKMLLDEKNELLP